MHRNRFLFLVLILTLVLAACGGEEDEPKDDTPSLTPITYQLSWTHYSSFAPQYVAKDKGYFREQGLDVTILPGGFDADGNFIEPIEQVLSGAADFGVVDGSLLLAARAAGKPVVAVSALYQKHPLALTSLAENDIQTPQDLIGATVQISDNSEVLFQALLAAQDIDPALVNVVPRTDFSTAPLTNGEADVIDGWIVNEIVALDQAGINVNMILPADYAVDSYAMVIFTTETMIAEQPQIVEKFVQASIQGMQTAVDEPAYAGALALEYDSNLNLDTEVAIVERAVPLINPPDVPIGSMNPEVWSFMHQTLLDQGVLTEPLDIEAAYNLGFLAEPSQQG